MRAELQNLIKGREFALSVNGVNFFGFPITNMADRNIMSYRSSRYHKMLVFSDQAGLLCAIVKQQYANPELDITTVIPGDADYDTHHDFLSLFTPEGGYKDRSGVHNYRIGNLDSNGFATRATEYRCILRSRPSFHEANLIDNYTNSIERGYLNYNVTASHYSQTIVSLFAQTKLKLATIREAKYAYRLGNQHTNLVSILDLISPSD